METSANKKARGRGRPPTPGSLADIIQKAGSPKFSSEELAINQDVTGWSYVDELISYERAERLDALRPARARKLSDEQRQRMKNKLDRELVLKTELLKINSALSASSAAALLKKNGKFPSTSARTLRADIAKVKKELAAARNK